MPYSSVRELPKAVRDKIKSPKKRRQWMHVWNSEYARNRDESRAFASAWSVVKKFHVGVNKVNENLNFFMPICKVDKDTRTISGYASTNCLDSDGEVVSQDAIKAALPDYMAFGNIREMHRPWAVGVANEANIDERGLFLTAKIVDNDAWEKVDAGVYKGFSIGGSKRAKVGKTITKIDLTEISIVDRPANPECRFAINKMAGASTDAYLLPKAEVRKAIKDASDKEPDGDEDDGDFVEAKAKAAKKAKKLAKRKAKESASQSSPAAQDADGGAEAALGKVESRHELDLELTTLRGSDSGLAKLSLQGEDNGFQLRKSKGRKMDDTGTDNNALGKALIQFLNGQAQLPPTPNPALGLLKAAGSDIKALKKHRQEAESCVEKLFNMHKGALNKTSGGAFDHSAAAALLQTLYSNVGFIKQLTKSARDNLAKAEAGVSGNGKVQDGTPVYSTGPSGELRMISPDEMDNLPASKGASATDLAKYISPEQHEMLLKAARLEAENALLKSMPAVPSGGRRPSGFDLAKIGGGTTESDNALLKGINPSDLQSQDESTRETAVAKMVGNMLISGRGQTVLDPNFHGTAGFGRPN